MVLDWLQSMLDAVPWYVKIIIMVVCSIIATTILMPIPIADIALLAVLEHNHSLWWFALTVAIITLSDGVAAMLTYKLAHKTSRFIIRKKKQSDKFDRVVAKLNKQAPFWLFIAGATPFPFTLTVYAAAFIKYDFKKFTTIIFTSRLLKYIVITLLFYFGYNLISR